MDPNGGRLYPSREAALEAGVMDAVEITGNSKDIIKVSKAVRSAAKAKRQAQKKARKANR